MRYLQGDFQPQTCVQEFSRRGKHLSGVVADVGSDQLSVPAAGGGGFGQLVGVHARIVADAEGYAHASALESLGDLTGHVRALIGGAGRVAVVAAGAEAEIPVSRQHGHVYRGSVAVHQVQVIGGVGLVFAAVARHGRRHAHVQPAGENGELVIAHQAPLGVHGVLMHMDVDESGSHDPAGGVDHLVGVCLRRGDASVIYPQIPDGMDAVCGIDQSAVSDQCDHVHTPVCRSLTRL